MWGAAPGTRSSLPSTRWHACCLRARPRRISSPCGAPWLGSLCMCSVRRTSSATPCSSRRRLRRLTGPSAPAGRSARTLLQTRAFRPHGARNLCSRGRMARFRTVPRPWAARRPCRVGAPKRCRSGGIAWHWCSRSAWLQSRQWATVPREVWPRTGGPMSGACCVSAAAGSLHWRRACRAWRRRTRRPWASNLTLLEILPLTRSTCWALRLMSPRTRSPTPSVQACTAATAARAPWRAGHLRPATHSKAAAASSASAAAAAPDSGAPPAASGARPRPRGRGVAGRRGGCPFALAGEIFVLGYRLADKTSGVS
mmetsp:Transcript_82010/g.265700  ORF Transcript_82010/g.265700 Transcript_82010/m.265700 type:complete len:312 (-) Transcript_82010:1262-2197(-)